MTKHRTFSLRENEHGPELRFGDLDGIVFEDGLDECIAANLVLWLNRMLASERQRTIWSLREPTEAMVEAGAQAEWDSCFTGDYYDPSPDEVSREACRNGAKVSWAAMIDAALAPSPSQQGEKAE